MKRAVLTTVVALAAAVLTTPIAAATPAPAITWGACSDAALVAGGAQCGTLAVPLDPAKPGGTQITLALSRVEHTGPENAYQGVVVSMPGVLTGTGLANSLLGGQLPGGVGANYDWIGFSPRGMAPSSPSLDCVAGYQTFNRPDYVTTTPIAEAFWLNRTKGYADACARNQPELIKHLKTTDTAADVERIRGALGVDQVTVFAQSYGTYTGQVYATRYPTKVRRMVLDGNVDPRRIWTGAAAFDQDVPLERNLHLWFDWLATHDDVYHLGTTGAAVNAVWDRQLAAVTANPAGGAIGPDEWIDVFLFVSYFQSTWTTMGGILSQFAQTGDPSTLQGFFAFSYQSPAAENTFASLLGTTCTDAAWPKDWSRWRAESTANHVLAPNTTWGNTWANAPCFWWGAPAGTPVRVDGSGITSALLVHQTLDAATPYEGSLEVRSRFPHASLISVPGGTDHAAGPAGPACVTAAVSAYLATGTLPARKPGRQADATCAPNPLPTP